MPFLQVCCIRGCDFAAGFAQQGIHQESAAHPYTPMDPPNGQARTRSFQRLSPGQYVLINAIDERAVKIKQNRRHAISRGEGTAYGHLTSFESICAPAILGWQQCLFARPK